MLDLLPGLNKFSHVQKLLCREQRETPVMVCGVILYVRRKLLRVGVSEPPTDSLFERLLHSLYEPFSKTVVV